MTDNLAFEDCVFEGEPPTPNYTWSQWAAHGPPYRGVRVRSLDTRDRRLSPASVSYVFVPTTPTKANLAGRRGPIIKWLSRYIFLGFAAVAAWNSLPFAVLLSLIMLIAFELCAICDAVEATP